ncbi:MAG: hypothetical protein AB8B65_06600 [Kordia sp.]|uniref:hypothetical protein n=1 Tax=Kordia sp. TaxID=1965332 RepID=UPI0038593118
MKHLKKNIITILMLTAIVFFCNAQDSQYETQDKANLIFTGTSIKEAVAFETSLNSKLEKPFAHVTLSQEMYPHVKKYTLASPKEFLRNTPKSIPAHVEYYYDKFSRKVKFTSYRWDFVHKVSDAILFNRKKLRKLVEKECGELQAYNTLFSQLDTLISEKFSSSEKKVKQNQKRDKSIEWNNETTAAILKMEFQDCSSEGDLLPGYFVIQLTVYSK